MSEVHRYSVVKMLSAEGNAISYSPHGPEVVMADAFDALRQQLADVSNERDELRRQLESLTVEEDREDARKVFVRTNTGQGKSISLDDMLARYAPATDEQGAKKTEAQRRTEAFESLPDDYEV